MKFTAFIFLLIFVVAVAQDYIDENDKNLFIKCEDEFTTTLENIAEENGDVEEFLKTYDCHLQAMHLLTPDRKLDFEKLKNAIPFMPEFSKFDSESIQNFINEKFEKCKALSQGGTNDEMFTTTYTCLINEAYSWE